MLANSQEIRNTKPRSEGRSQLQGKQEDEDANGNYTATTDLKASRSRYDKGMGLYKSGRVSIGSNGVFRASAIYEVDTEKMQCEYLESTTDDI